MRESKLTVVVVALVFVGLLMALVTFTVRVDEMAVLYHWNKPKLIIKPTIGLGIAQEGPPESSPAEGDAQIRRRAGWFFKWPYPIDRVEKYDQRVRTIIGTLTQQQLRDAHHVLPRLYATWRIVDPIAFERTLRNDVETAKKRLKTIMSDHSGIVFGEHQLSDVVNTDESRLQFDQIERRIFEGVKASLEGQEQPYGIELCSLGISWVTLPEEATKKVFERMQKERGTIAERLRAEGDREMRTLIAQARTEYGRIMAEAEAEAQGIQTQGEAEAARYDDTFAKNQPLAIFLRRLQAIRRIAARAAETDRPMTLVLTTKTDPLRLFEWSLAEQGMEEPPPPQLDEILDAVGGDDLTPPAGE